MSRHNCRVVGHRLVKRGESEVLEVKLSNSDGLRATIIAEPSERDSYPLGCEASIGFTVQQSLPLEPGTGGADPARTRRARNGSASAEAN